MHLAFLLCICSKAERKILDHGGGEQQVPHRFGGMHSDGHAYASDALERLHH